MNMRITGKEFKQYVYDPDWYVETWTGHAIGPKTYRAYLDIEGMVNCHILEEIKIILVLY